MHIKNLQDVRKTHVPAVGGKGAALGELIYAGIPVPPGFVVTTAAFSHFLAANNLNKPTAQDILQASIPDQLASEISAEHTKLASPFVAVRSSATAEDGASHAWAGQLESYVPTSANDILQNIIKCWASLFSPRALAYRQQAGLHADDVSIAVVVQQLIDSEHAGIAFSQHPVTGNADHIVIESVCGLGEAAVGGHVTPDTYIVGKHTGEIIEQYPGTQDKKLVRGAQGNAEWQPTANEPALATSRLQDLAGHVKTIEAHFSVPMDVEWAHAHNTFYIVQSRPITT